MIYNIKYAMNDQIYRLCGQYLYSLNMKIIGATLEPMNPNC